MLGKILIALFLSGAVPQFQLRDTQGALHGPAEWAGHKAVVIFFVTIDCPIGNGYVPGHAELTLDLLRRQGDLRKLFEQRYV